MTPYGKDSRSDVHVCNPDPFLFFFLFCWNDIWKLAIANSVVCYDVCHVIFS